MFLFGEVHDDTLNLDYVERVTSYHDEYEIKANDFINRWYKSDDTKAVSWSLYKNHIRYVERIKNKFLYNFSKEEVIDIVAAMPTTSPLNKRRLFDFINNYMSYNADVLHTIPYNPCNSINPDEICVVGKNIVLRKIVSKDRLFELVYMCAEEKDYNTAMPAMLARFGIMGKGCSEILNLRWSDLNWEDRVVTVCDEETGFTKKLHIEDDRFWEVLKDHKAQEFIKTDNIKYSYKLITIDDFVIKHAKSRGAMYNRDHSYILNMNTKMYKILGIKSVSLSRLFDSFLIEQLLEKRKYAKISTLDIIELLNTYSRKDTPPSSWSKLRKLWDSLFPNDPVVVMRNKEASIVDNNSEDVYLQHKKELGL